MAELHEALKALSPIDWSDVPTDNLSPFLSTSFAASELICNTVPPPPNGEPFESCRPHHTRPNEANSAKEMHPSTVRSFPPHKDHESLQHAWGKPLKIGQAQNPLGVAVYKMAGHDRHGAWFARRSVHEGIGFEKFHQAMRREFPHSLSVEGGPGAGAVRGLAGDKRIEKQEVDGVGCVEVYQLSAQFPGPVTPRDFMTMLMTTNDALTHKSGLAVDDGRTHVPRHFMIVSRPVSHPDAPGRAGYVRGQYESVELIREIPLDRGKSNPSEADQGEASIDPEVNPVEWIMITRSDPGGGIPRFLVDRGTPEAMLGDMNKFLDWACATPNSADGGENVNGDPQANTAKLPNGQTPHDGPNDRPAATFTSQQQGGGFLSTMTQTVGAGLDAYAPAAVSQQVHNYLHRDDPDNDPEDESDTSSEASSDSFTSAAEMRRQSLAPGSKSNEDLSIASGVSEAGDKKGMNHHDKEVQKLIQQREKLDRKLAKKRTEEENKLKKNQEKEQGEQEKAKEKLEREMKKTEEKHRKDIEKLEAKREKEAQKAEQKRRKKEDQNKLSLVTRERDEFSSQLDLHRRENGLLAERVEELQHENALLASRLTALAGGKEALKGVQEEVAEAGRKRRGSVRSDGSKRS